MGVSAHCTETSVGTEMIFTSPASLFHKSQNMFIISSQIRFVLKMEYFNHMRTVGAVKQESDIFKPPSV